MTIKGRWFDGKSSKSCDALLVLNDTGRISVTDAASHEVLIEVDTAELDISSRLGNSARFVRFANGSAFETVDNAAVDALQKSWHKSTGQGLLHKLESHLGLVAVAAILVIVLVVGGAVYGVPATARLIAFQLPQNTLDTVAAETMGILDRTHFDDSELSDERQAQLQAEFKPVLAQYPDMPLKVEFRKGGDSIGANAFALPDGTIIFTDEMIELSQTAAERIAVLAHEIGHVAERHSLRAVIQNAVLGFVYVTLVGDGTAMGDLLIGLPVLATTMSYSRDHETEADVFSAQFLDHAGIERQAFVDLMQRLGDTMRCNELIDDAKDVDEDALSDTERLALCETLIAEGGDEDDSQWQDYLSTHPGLKQRLIDFTAE
ncbi:M48 family metallopeptidase [Gilvimarinus polysaccharolyticus]|uniref:M48 family metallopeptidase n=1 Tax=Gilvimarinus polysaccharolyticus TaxID=863921 RepID=UPI000673374E|nr:M48 family metallopeptidase [Gilvimarinus polysaccharolyticus]